MSNAPTPDNPEGADVNETAPSRRGLLLGAGALAAAAGLGLAWWQGSKPLAGGASEPFPGFWDQQWDTPQGGTLRMQELRGKPLLINFWATWCPPCIEELPLLNQFFRQNRVSGWQVVGLAVDRPSAVQGFLQRMPLDFPIGLAGTTGGELGKKLGNPSGALPYSVAIASKGDVAHRKLGRLHAEDLDLWGRLK